MDLNSKDGVTYSEKLNVLICVGEFVWTRNFKYTWLLGHDEFRSQAYSSSGTSTSTVTKPETEVQLPVSRRTKTSRKGGGGGCKLAFYIFQISALDVGKWSLTRFKGNTSGTQQREEMMGPEDTSDTLWNVKIQIHLLVFELLLCVLFLM
jgi:hypothetical protein